MSPEVTLATYLGGVLLLIILACLIARIFDRLANLTASVKWLIETVGSQAEQIKGLRPAECTYNKLNYNERRLLVKQITAITRPGSIGCWLLRQQVFCYLGGFVMHRVEWRKMVPGYAPGYMLDSSEEMHLSAYRDMLVSALAGDDSLHKLWVRLDKLISVSSPDTLAAAIEQTAARELGLDAGTIRWDDPLPVVLGDVLQSLGCRSNDRLKHLQELVEAWEKLQTAASQSSPVPAIGSVPVGVTDTTKQLAENGEPQAVVAELDQGTTGGDNSQS